MKCFGDVENRCGTPDCGCIKAEVEDDEDDEEEGEEDDGNKACGTLVQGADEDVLNKDDDKGTGPDACVEDEDVELNAKG